MMDAREWNEYYADNDDPWTRPDDDLIDEVTNLPAGRALDLGAGEGANSIWLARRGWEVTSIEQAPVAIDTLARLATGEGLSIRGEVADVANYCTDVQYDLVLICYLPLPADTRRRTLVNAAAALGPGGVLLLIGIPVSAPGPVEPAISHKPSVSLGVADEIAGSFPQLSIERCDVRRVIGCAEGELRSDVMLIRARRAVSDDAGDLRSADPCTEK